MMIIIIIQLITYNIRIIIFAIMMMIAGRQSSPIRSSRDPTAFSDVQGECSGLRFIYMYIYIYIYQD